MKIFYKVAQIGWFISSFIRLILEFNAMTQFTDFLYYLGLWFFGEAIISIVGLLICFAVDLFIVLYVSVRLNLNADYRPSGFLDFLCFTDLFDYMYIYSSTRQRLSACISAFSAFILYIALFYGIYAILFYKFGFNGWSPMF